MNKFHLLELKVLFPFVLLRDYFLFLNLSLNVVGKRRVMIKWLLSKGLKVSEFSVAWNTVWRTKKGDVLPSTLMSFRLKAHTFQCILACRAHRSSFSSKTPSFSWKCCPGWRQQLRPQGHPLDDFENGPSLRNGKDPGDEVLAWTVETELLASVVNNLCACVNFLITYQCLQLF